MSLYAGQSIWPDQIYLVEQTDPVLGGENGIENQNVKELSDRTRFLYDHLGRQKNISDIYILNDDVVTVPNTELLNNQTMVVLYGLTGGIIVDETVDLPDGSVIKMYIMGEYGNPGSVVKIQFTNTLMMMGYEKTYVYLYTGESIELVKHQSHWYIMHTTAPLVTVGTPYYGYKIMPGSVFRDGRLLLRKRYPRLFDFVTSLASSPHTGYWNDQAWNGPPNAGMLFKGGFSGGDSTTTFRIPDDRGMFERSIDAGANIDLDRSSQNNGNYVGRQQMDSFKAHKHMVKGSSASSVGFYVPSMIPAGNPGISNHYSESEGGSETRPKNSSKIPLIVY